MESPKKQIPPSWDEIVRLSREESPPSIDVRASVRARLESELRLSANGAQEPTMGLLEGILDLFANPLARLTLIGSFGAAAILTFATTRNLEVSELTDNETIIRENFDEAIVGVDWTEYL